VSSIRLAARLVSRNLFFSTFGPSHRYLTLGSVSFASAGIETGLLTVRAELRTLIFRKAGLRLRFRDLHFPIGQVDSVRCQILVDLWLLSGAHGSIRLFDRRRRAGRQVRI
jgi:hypothetical protein